MGAVPNLNRHLAGSPARATRRELRVTSLSAASAQWRVQSHPSLLPSSRPAPFRQTRMESLCVSVALWPILLLVLLATRHWSLATALLIATRWIRNAGNPFPLNKNIVSNRSKLEGCDCIIRARFRRQDASAT